MWGKDIARILRRADGPQTVARIGRLLVLSIAIQLSTMAAYISVARALAPDIGGGEIAAATAVVMLAAALPISLAGWGIRELSAIYALGVIGLPKEASLLVALVVGCAALAVVIAMALGSLAAGIGRPASAPKLAAPRHAVDYGTALAWCLPLLAAAGVFFQIHVPLASGRLNVNLADPLAIIGGVLLVAGLIKERRLLEWRLPGLNLHFAVMTVLLVAAFAHGWIEYGWIAWAFTNRLVGWFVLLGYAATGALIVIRGGDAGFAMLLRTFAMAAIALILLEAAIFIAVVVGFQVPMEIIRYRIDGFSQNANAFALLVLLAIGAHHRRDRPPAHAYRHAVHRVDRTVADRLTVGPDRPRHPHDHDDHDWRGRPEAHGHRMRGGRDRDPGDQLAPRDHGRGRPARPDCRSLRRIPVPWRERPPRGAL